MADYTAGDYGQADLAADERRAVVRGHLQVAARRPGLAPRFRAGPGLLTFHVEAALPYRPARQRRQQVHVHHGPMLA